MGQVQPLYYGSLGFFTFQMQGRLLLPLLVRLGISHSDHNTLGITTVVFAMYKTYTSASETMLYSCQYILDECCE